MHRNRVPEQSKDFYKAIARLIKELKSFKVVVIFALLLAIISAILTIISPNQLSKLTDEIQTGLMVKKDNITLITNNIMSNINSLKEFKIDNVTISISDQTEFLKVFSNLNENTSVEEIYSSIDKLPSSIQSVVRPSMNMEAILKIVVFLIGLYIFSALLSFAQSFIMTIVSNKFAYKLRRNISSKINKLPLRYFDKNQVGDTLSRVTNDVDTIAQSMNQSLATLVSNITLFIGTLIMMFITNYIMAITAILSSIIGFIFMFLVLGKSQKYFKARQEELGNLNSHIEEVYSGLLAVKAYNGQNDANKEFDDLNKKVYDANRKSQFLGGLMPATMMFIGNFGYVSVCIVGALLTQNNMISFGVIVAFMTYIRLFTNPLQQIAQSMNALQTTAAASERVFEFMDEEEMTMEEATKKLDKNKVAGNISFEHVKFAYDEDKTIIKDFTADIKAGQKIAIVGPTGAGKTTMVNLLMKFYDIKDGDIKIDGISIKELSRENIHELFTMVLQDTWLFSGTIKENIKFNRKKVSEERVKEVINTVGLGHFVNTLPNTYDFVLEENESISQGQKQLLTIARGMVEDAPFLILDEATSNVDTRTEELVQSAMDKISKGKTSFIIAHRLSTIKNADLILVMKDGNIVEQGNHDYLLNKNGFYAQIYNSQFQN